MNKIMPSAAALLLSASLGGALAGGAGAPVSGPATGAVTGGAQVQAATPQAITAALRAAGYTVTVDPVVANEDPGLTVRAGEREFGLWFSGCQAGSCSRVTASFGWDSGAGGGPDLDLVNEWNGNYFTQAYIYEGRYYLDSTLPLRGGYTRAALTAWLSDYLGDVEDFGAGLP